ncbi:hypothetical protein PAI11_29810 [Patulibacter medicamentivorans]|uniref:IPT/TIG domain-containing protein n=1 Tax=Patulibacter medicamentivorans TaxID=1097667 RepID=H0E824_9ACTN|nr:hypothetical protein [Patulibacter medicamentivorans]EHN10222.1 hypothetical protein PAI11_29810 [Patulibacter medicamentivorans]
MPASLPSCRPRSSAALALLLALLAVLLVAGPARADQSLTVDFESGPALDTPVSDQYAASAFVTFPATTAARGYEGPRPHRLLDATRARSGSHVANIGTDLCQREASSGEECEFPIAGTVGQLSRTAKAVRVYVGLLAPEPGTVTARLRAYRADGSTIATGAPATVASGRFSSEVAVSSAASDIARFQLLVEGGGAVGIDDLMLTFPDGNGPADVALGLFADQVAVPRGTSVDVPFTATRLNGSDGSLAMSVSGLPVGVTGDFQPNPLTGIMGAGTLRLSAAPNAPAFNQPLPSTIKADPAGNVAAAPAPRTATLPIRVSEGFSLTGPADPSIALARCARQVVPVTLVRDISFRESLTVAVTDLPKGVTATVEPGPTVEPGGPRQVDLKVVFRGTPEQFLPGTAQIVAGVGGASAVPAQSIAVPIGRAERSAQLRAPAEPRLATPQRGRGGTAVELAGTGFCADTGVLVGKGGGRAKDVVVSEDGRTLRFTTPRLAMSGEITILSPGGNAYPVNERVTVSTFRDTAGLRFPNAGVDGLSFGEAVDAFGADELFVTVNPCWPWGSCKVPTPVPDPLALASFAVVQAMVQGTPGRCFGMIRGVQGWLSGRTPLRRFTDSPNPFDIAPVAPDQVDRFSHHGIPRELNSFLDGQQALQFSTEFARTTFGRGNRLPDGVRKIRQTLGAGQLPGLILRNGLRGHAVLVHSVVDYPDGSVDLEVYNPSYPYLITERDDPTQHVQRELTFGTVRIEPDGAHWTFEAGNSATGVSDSWRGDGHDFQPFTHDQIPRDPSLPGLAAALEGLHYLMFGTGGGAAESNGGGPDDDLVPVVQGTAGGNALIRPAKGKRLSHTVRGVRAGRYTQALVGDRQLAKVDVPAAPGVSDTTSEVEDGLAFAAGERAPLRALKVDVGAVVGGRSRIALVEARSGGGDRETVRLDDGATLRYDHRGGATSVSFSLSGERPDGSLETFASGPVRLAAGESLAARPTSWSSLSAVRLSVRDRHGRTRTRVLRNRAHGRGSVAIRDLRVRGGRAGLRLRLAGLPRTAAGGVVLRAVRAGRTVGRRTIALKQARNGVRRISWRLPRAARARGTRLQVQATVVSARGTVRQRAVARVAR